MVEKPTYKEPGQGIEDLDKELLMHREAEELLLEGKSVCMIASFIDTTQQKLFQNQLIRSERLAATGQLAASIAHEINSPLQALTSLLNVISKTHEEDEELLKNIDLLKGAYSSIRNTVQKLLDLNRPSRERKQSINVNVVIEDTVTLLQSHLKKNKVKVNLYLSSRVPDITASPQQLGQALMNLINNAVEAMTGVSHPKNFLKDWPFVGGEININTNLRKGSVVIKVADTGPGISEEDLQNIFDPFYTRKKTMGMGIGLSICYGIIDGHKGTVETKNSPDGGAVFTISLPVG